MVALAKIDAELEDELIELTAQCQYDPQAWALVAFGLGIRRTGWDRWPSRRAGGHQRRDSAESKQREPLSAAADCCFQWPRYRQVGRNWDALRDVDGYAGLKTRVALYTALLALSGASTKMAAFSAAPVVEEKTVVPVTVEQAVKKKFNIIGWIGSLFGGGSSLSALAGFDWKALLVIVAAVAVIGLGVLFLRHWIIAAIKDIREAVES